MSTFLAPVTSHHPLHSIAFKFEDESVETILRDIEWSMGRTCITPVAIFNTVEIDGTDISRASLHNVSIFQEFELGIGDTISIFKANQIIPQVLENKTKSNTATIPNICPVCGSNTAIRTSKLTKILVCTSNKCKGTLLSRIVHFASKKAMNIDGLSSETIEKFIDNNIIESFADIYRIEEYKDKIICIEGFGKRSYEKLIKSIEKSKKVKLHKFIISLGIPNIGTKASKTISKYFNGEWLLFEQAIIDGFNFRCLDDFGDIMHKNIYKYFQNKDNIKLYSELLEFIEFETNDLEQSNIIIKDNPFIGKKVLATGTLERYSRDGIKARLESIGAIPISGVSKKTDYVIAGSAAGQLKIDKANELNIPILTEMEFLKMIGDII